MYFGHGFDSRLVHSTDFGRTLVQGLNISVFKNIFSIIVNINFEDVQEKTERLTFSVMQKYIKDTYNVDVSKSSIIQMKNKCGIDKLERHTKRVENITLKSEKEKLVFETFKHFEIISV